MRFNALLASTSLVSALASLTLAPAQAQTAAALTGQVSSAEEATMEGVLVSAKKEGSTVTTTVVSNDKGQYSFPAGRLEPGHYNITIRAAGYTLAGPKTVDIPAGSPATADIKLEKVANQVPQLSSAEWLLSAPGDDKIKSFLPDCVGCHTLQRIFTSTHDPEEFKAIFTRMGRYAPETVPTHLQLIKSGGARSERPRVPAAMMDAAADYLASVNLSGNDQEGFTLKRLPRPKGRATHVIVTEYDLPRKEAQPHDVIVDTDGHAWYSDFGNQYVGELDPKTGKVSDYKLPLLRDDQPRGSLDMEFDPDGNIWVGMSYQAGASKIDRKTKEVKTFPLPPEWAHITTQTNMVTPTHMYVDNKVWMTDTETHNLYRLDLKTGQWENKGEATSADGKKISGYGLPTDKDNNVYMFSFGDTRIGVLDAKTNVAQIWATPTPRSRPRRGRLDDQGHVWFGEYAGNAIGMFDPATQQIKEWKLPTAWSEPYDVAPSKDGAEVWTGSMLSDQIDRLDTKTAEITEYLLPHSTNIRRVSLQETGGRQVLWFGNNHGAAIVKVEPLD
ncbi:MAG TPA: carboxypeptidase regulatory-like domain-containing protein [Xanthobacteraceae bacterium]|nr:carboxypeptidase regulatory-like domain-containing protein [Xanthobacteraceae bacterium]